MFDPFLTLSEPQLVFLCVGLGIIASSLTLIACVAAVQYRKFRSREMELAFKDDLLDRGLSAAEVDLLWTGSRPNYFARFWQAVHDCWRLFAKCCRKVTSGCIHLCRRIARAVSERASRRTEQELAFKRELLDRGLGVAEIERLLAARQPGVVSWIIECLRWSASAVLEFIRWAGARIAAVSQKVAHWIRSEREEWRWEHR